MNSPIDTVDKTFPGPWVAGSSLIFAPLLLLAGTLARADSDFFFPHQLSAFADHPTRMRLAYSLFLAGNIILFPAIIWVAQQIQRSRPLLGIWGGMLVLLGLMARSYHYGVNNAMFVAVDKFGVEKAVQLVGDFYSTREWVVASLTGAILAGWVVLAIGAFLSRAMPWWRCIGLLAMAPLMIGVLKGTNALAIISIVGLAIALVPHGILTFRDAARPERRTVIMAVIGVAVALPSLIFIGQQG